MGRGSDPRRAHHLPEWRNGSRSRLKICRDHSRVGSSPTSGTNIFQDFYKYDEKMEIFFIILGLLIFGIIEIFQEGAEQNRRIKENMRRYPSMFKMTQRK